jgi:hypothetical protein
LEESLRERESERTNSQEKTMQIHEVDPNARIEGFVRRFDLPNWRDVETNLYLTLSRATDLAPPEPKRPPYVDPYDDPYPLYRKVPGNPNSPPPIITTPHVIEKNLVYVDPKPMTGMVQNVLREYREHPNYILTAHAREYQEAMACFQLCSAVIQWPDKYFAFKPPCPPSSLPSCVLQPLRICRRELSSVLRTPISKNHIIIVACKTSLRNPFAYENQL